MENVCRLSPMPKVGTRVPRVRNALRARGVMHLRIVYCVFEGSPVASLSVTAEEPGARIALPHSLTTTIKLLFRRGMSDPHPPWRDGAGSAGVLCWDLLADAWAHQHFGYRQQFVRQHRLVPTRPGRSQSRRKPECHLAQSARKCRRW